VTPAADGRAPALVCFDEVTKRYGGRPVIESVSFSIARSEFVLLTGASGAGKSTVLRLMAAIEQPTSGAIFVGGQDLSRLSGRAVTVLRRSMGIVMQQLLLLDDRTVLENIALPALAAGAARRVALERARVAMTRVGLEPAVEAALPRSLAGGEQQRAAFARAIVNNPALVLADEPTAHLDAHAAAGLVRLLEQFVVAGVTVVMATHSLLSPRPQRARVLNVVNGRMTDEHAV
jgi:cell division transport system ATP-binding protein